MNPNRRLIVAWSLMQVTLAGTGCSSTPKITRQTYTEKVSTVMITQDKKQFVILGERYHYIFTAPEDLVALLGSPLKAKAAARFQPFLVTVDGVTTGDFHLTLPAGLNDEEATQAKAMDFVQQADGTWWHDGTLEGKRYIQGHTLRTGRIHANLSHTYEVSVEAEETAGEKAAQDLASPIASTADGMLMVYFAVLVPILIPLIFLTREKKPTEKPTAAAVAPVPASAP
jgi:hypothetical protein